MDRVIPRWSNIARDVRRSTVISAPCAVWRATRMGPSLLEPIFFVLYTAELNQVVMAHAHHHLKLHQYADDCQVYVSSLADDAGAIADTFSNCMADIATRMNNNNNNNNNNHIYKAPYAQTKV